MDKPFSIQRLDGLEARNNRLKYIQKNFPMLTVKAKMSLFVLCLYQYQSMLRSNNVENREIYEQIIGKYINSLDFSKNEKKNLLIKEKIWIGLVSKSLNITCKLRNLIKIGI